MSNHSKKVLAIVLVVLLSVACVFAQSIKEVIHGEYQGKTVILHSNDVHGAIEGYAKMAALRDYYVSEGADVILIDAGDFSQGTMYVNVSKGYNAVQLMNRVGYDIAGLGNHDFDYSYEQLVSNLATAQFEILCANIFNETGNSIYPAFMVGTTDSGLKIGFFAMDTPETQTKANPVQIKGLQIPTGDKFFKIAQDCVDALKAQNVDLIICIAHLGIDNESKPYTSYELLERISGIDYLIDGHSHSVFTDYDGLADQQTGTGFVNIGVIVIDEEGKIEDAFLRPTEDLPSDEDVLSFAQGIINQVDAEYSIKFAESKVDLNGDKAPGNRTMETNLGDLVADSILWSITRDPSSVTVPTDNIVAMTNGGGIRAWLRKGDITKKDINTVQPFGNTVSVIYVTGKQILEVLEASTYLTPDAVGGFPQIAGMEITIDTTKAYEPNAETYPNSTYYGPASINRVTVNSINGKDFDPDATYAVVTNNFCAAGGDTYYAFASTTNQFDTGMPLDEILMEYITTVLGGVIDEKYAEPAGRITIIK